ncbi:uncharacterized protein EI90DRAFT_3032954 [Cantharellus anzutake]|uniref:uncharacterized protein n=1 Tax=Cantharellus anzutake TaxID=1750568 RepID=UPI0019039E8F|nr:uncharacterized protein EI90DRAFT_3032954 [Cantharellus anzutake]KAF8342341.1 hypothetical protein EI90DRAFT_3032954 [Cantharellus anzutake]
MRVVLIGVGGATCSGKTTLAKHLRNCLPNSYIVHQDDFAPPTGEMPVHPEYGVPDWDDAAGAIDWPRLRSALAHVKTTGKLPDSHTSRDHFNKQILVPIREGSVPGWLEKFHRIAEGSEEEVIYAIVEGFLLYWDKEIMDQIDVRIMLRAPHDTLKQRRVGERREYITTGKFVCLHSSGSPSTSMQPPFLSPSLSYALIRYLIEFRRVQKEICGRTPPVTGTKSSIPHMSAHTQTCLRAGT